MNITELKLAINEMNDYMRFALSPEHFKRERDALNTLLSTCQLLCDVSDKMLPKKDKYKAKTDIMVGCPYCERAMENCQCYKVYNLARSEDILWLTKKMMGIDDIIADLKRVKIFIEYAKYELEDGLATIGSQFPHKEDADKEIKKLEKVVDLLNAIRQEMGGGE